MGLSILRSTAAMPMVMVGNLHLTEVFGRTIDGFSNHSDVAVFQLAVEKDPTFIYGYFYLGRAFEKGGKVDDAITAYKKAIIIGKTSRAANEAAYQIRHLEKCKLR